MEAKPITPPHDAGLEEAVLGAMLVEQNSIDEFLETCDNPEVFYAQKNKNVFKAIKSLYGKGEAIDLLTVTAELKKPSYSPKVDAFYITSLTSKVNSAAHIQMHARILTELFMRREAYSRGSEIMQKAFDQDLDVFDMMDDVEQALFELRGNVTRQSYSQIDSIVKEYFKELESRIALKDKGELQGVPSGILSIDRITGGWKSPDLIIIAARPSMGKSSLTVSVIRNAAVDFNMPVAIFSLEMSKSQIVERIIAAESEIIHEKFKKGDINEAEWQQILRKTARLVESKIFIDDTAGISLMELKAKARKLKKSEGIKLIAIDYLQLMKAGGKSGNREQEISAISRGLKEMAKELEVPVIALSQLSRAVETRGGDKRPMLSDLRESGAIEQDADIVCFIYRPEYYGITEDENGKSVAGLGELIFAKHRNGNLDTAMMQFVGKYIKYKDFDDGFDNYTHVQESNYQKAIPSGAAAFEEESPF